MAYTTVINQASSKGTVRSGKIGSDAPTCFTVAITALMDSVDILSLAKSLTLTLLVSFDGQTFSSLASVTWTGGAQSVAKIDGVTAQPPALATAAPPGASAYQLQLDTVLPVSVGAGIDLLDINGGSLPVTILL
jgi:hypothetical protein